MDSREFTAEQLSESLTFYARNGQSMPKPNTNPRKGIYKKDTKYSRRAHKCESEGRCPHCGKPCAPFFACKERRESQRMSRILREMVNEGLVEIVSEGGGKKTIYRRVA